MKKILILIPIYNEADIILSVIKDIRRNGYKNIIIVDDGSTDKTFTLLKKQKIVYLRHAINRGKGAAVKTGMISAKLLDADILITIDGDGQHFAKDIPKLVKKINEGYAVVLGNRSYLKGQMPIIRIASNKFANIVTGLLYGAFVKDSQSGFRAYSKKALTLINTRSDGYEFDSEIIREIKINNLSYTQVTIHTHYTKHSLTKLKKQNMFNGIKMLFRMIMSV